MRRLTARYELSLQERQAVEQFLLGTLNARELGDAIGVSHQQALLLVCKLCRQWLQDGTLQFTEHVRQERRELQV